MTVTGLWQEIGAGENIVTRFFRVVFVLAALAVFCFLVALPLPWQQQTVCGLLMLLMAVALSRGSDSYLITLALLLMSIFCTVRYGYWRVTQTMLYFEDPATHWGALDAFFIFSLLLAEGMHSWCCCWATFRASGRCAVRRWSCPTTSATGRMWMC